MDHTPLSSDAQETQRATRPLWRNADFLLIWSGQMVSSLGTNISALALPLLILALTHSPALAGLLAATRQIPYLLVSLPAGALVDRWDRKKTMIMCDLLRLLTLASVPVAFVMGHLTLIQLYLVAFVEGTAYVLFSLAQISALPQVVEPAHLPRAYALDVTTEYITTLLGPVLSAFIISLFPMVQIGAILAYLVDSISYLVSVCSLLGVHASFQAQPIQEAAPPRRLFREIATGLRFLWGHRTLRSMALLTALLNFLLSSLDLAVIVLLQSRLHLGVQFIGLVLSVGGCGGILGSILAPWLRQRLRCGRLLLFSVIIWAVVFFLLTLTPWLPLLLIGKFLISLTWPTYAVTIVSYRLARTPSALQGRVNSAFRSLSYGSEPLGSALGGLLLVLLGAQAVFGLVAVGFVGGILLVLWTGLHKV